MGTTVLDDVVGKIAEEIDSINTGNSVEYEPQAWTREGNVD